MTWLPPFRPWALPRAGANSKGRRQGANSAPNTTKKINNSQGWALGNLLFWDVNGDGRFRWCHGDFVTTLSGKRVGRGTKILRQTLEPAGLRYAWELNSLWRRVQKKPTPEFREGSHPKERLQAQKYRLGDALLSGDYRRFEEELRQYQVLLIAKQNPLSQADIQLLREEARMFSYLKDAANSVRMDRPDLALSDLRRAQEHAKKAGIPWEREDLLIALNKFTEGKIPEIQLENLLDRLD
jgi:hypothetical protein